MNENSSINEQNIDLKKELKAWFIYDWANSAYPTLILTVFLGPYLASIAKNSANKLGYVNFLGLELLADSVYAYAISFSVIFQFLLFPILGAIADFGGFRKRYMMIFAYLGATCTVCMYFVSNSWLLGVFLLIVSNFFFGAANVMYNSFLNDIASDNEKDKISSKGWAVGYAGGSLILIVSLILFLFHDKISLDEGHAIRICLALAGIWWAVFTIIPLKYLRKDSNQKLPKGFLSSSYKTIFRTIKEIKTNRNTMLFIIAFLLFNDGVQTVIAMASVFGKMELKLTQEVLIQAIVIVQILAIPGSLIFGKIAEKYSAKTSIMISLILWSLILIYVFNFLQTQNEFYIVAACLALVLGGTQALSRSMFSSFIPRGKEAEYFGIYEISDKGTSWIGTMIFALSLQFSHSYRLAVLSLIVFFIIGLVILTQVQNVKKIE